MQLQSNGHFTNVTLVGEPLPQPKVCMMCLLDMICLSMHALFCFAMHVLYNTRLAP